MRLKHNSILIVLTMFLAGASERPSIENCFFSQKDNLFKTEISASHPLAGAYTYYTDDASSEFYLDIIGFDAEERVYELNNPIVRSVELGRHQKLSNVTRCKFILMPGAVLSQIASGEDENRLIVIFEKLFPQQPAPSRETTETVSSVSASVPAKRNNSADKLAETFIATGMSEYFIGAGDVLNIQVYKNPDLSMQQVTVPLVGTITYPLLGDIKVVGLTIGELQRRIEESLREFLVNPQVMINIADYQSQWVLINGAVRKPGKYFLRGPTTIHAILAEAGGATQIRAQAPSVAFLTRKPGSETLILEIPLKSLYEEEDSVYNKIYLKNEDNIDVPAAANYVFVSGEVSRPGVYEYEDNMTVSHAILKAGGTTQWGSNKNITLIRAEDGQSKKFNINLNRIKRGKSEDIMLKPSDRIVINRRIL